jgi:hypothetical protein
MGSAGVVEDVTALGILDVDAIRQVVYRTARDSLYSFSASRKPPGGALLLGEGFWRRQKRRGSA